MSFDFLYTSTLNDTTLYIVTLILFMAFSSLYFSMSTGFYYLVKFTNRKRITTKINDRPLFPNQIKHEIKYSLLSIIIFALYGFLIIVLYRNQLIKISFNHGWNIIIDLAILAIWNEFHFYLGHRLMHTKLLVKFHSVHHKSVIVTPFSTYSFHPLESTIMGSVMILPLLIYPFEIWSLIIFPIYHLFFNTIGHTNVTFISNRISHQQNSISSRHNLHHTKFTINYGFISTFTDRIGKMFKST